MYRLALLFSLGLTALSAFAQTSSPVPSSDPQAISLAQQSIAALTGGMPVTDVTLNANVVSILGSDYESGSGVLKAKGIAESRVDLNLSGGIRSEVRHLANGTAAGGWSHDGSAATSYSNFNCWTDSAWFFPALSSLSQASNPTFTFKYIGLETHAGVNAQHIRVFQVPAGATPLLQHLSTIDFYLDPITFLPEAIAFAVHPDQDASADIPSEVRFAQYQTVGGVTVPFHIQRLLNGGVILDITITSAVFNTGLPDSAFVLP